MVRRSQLSLLQSVFAVGRTSSLGNLLPPPGRPVCCHKFNSPRATPAHSLAPPFRRFATSPRLEKKAKATKNVPVPDNAPDKGQQRSEMDPYDHTALESGIAKAIARLKEALTKTRSAGRISPETLENLPVQLSVTRGSGASGKESRRLGDVATVVPKGGRVMQVFVAQESHLKPTSSAILSSPHSLVPTPDAQNALLLNVPVPPPTAESRAQAAAEAKKSMERASLEVRTARADAQKRYRKMELGRKAGVDDLRKAHDGMEKVAHKGQEEVKKVYEQAIKALER